MNLPKYKIHPIKIYKHAKENISNIEALRKTQCQAYEDITLPHGHGPSEHSFSQVTLSMKHFYLLNNFLYTVIYDWS